MRASRSEADGGDILKFEFFGRLSCGILWLLLDVSLFDKTQLFEKWNYCDFYGLPTRSRDLQ